MILSLKEKQSLQSSLKSLSILGRLYLLQSSEPNPKKNKQKLLSFYSSKLPKDISTSWSQNRLSSWSHTPHCVGLWISFTSQHVGLDIEASKRLKPDLIRRILNPNDSIPVTHRHSEYLWNIKEASFKAVSLDNSIKTASQIYVSKLRVINPMLNQCMAIAHSPNNQDQLVVFCFQKNDFNFCIAQTLSNRLNN